MDENTATEQAESDQRESGQCGSELSAYDRGGGGGNGHLSGSRESGTGGPYAPVKSVSPVSSAARPVVDPFGPRPVGDGADPDESNGGLNALTGDEIVADIQRNVSCLAYCHARIIALIDEAERRDLWAQWMGVKSLPSWVMHVASVSAHTAREYVRVMHALREMPLVREALSAGEVSYSKVREVTRLADRIPDEDALRLAQVGTGAQVSMISRNYRKLSAARESGDLPSRLPQDEIVVCPAGPGRTRIVIDLPEDDAAEIVSMLEVAREIIQRRDRADAGEEASDDDESGPEVFDPWAADEEETRAWQERRRLRARKRAQISQVMCLMEVVRAFPHAQPSGAVDLDRARMLVHTSAEVLVRSAVAFGEPEHVPAGTSDDREHVPAGTWSGETGSAGSGGGDADGPGASGDETCRIDGFGGITAATAQRLACEALVGGIIKDETGNVLKLGRSKRLASRRQKMALSARDVSCQFPGCLSRRRCEAHHIRPWSRGGLTDLDNLVLLCRSHHIAVHEHDLTIARTGAPFSGALEAAPAFAFFLPDGTELVPYDDDSRGFPVFDTARLAAVEKATAGADPRTIGGGYGFDLGNCLAWMFEAEARHARMSEKVA